MLLELHLFIDNRLVCRELMMKCVNAGWTDSASVFIAHNLFCLTYNFEYTILASVFRLFSVLLLLLLLLIMYLLAYSIAICFVTACASSISLSSLQMHVYCFVLFRYWFGETMDVYACAYFRTNLHRFKRQYTNPIDVWCTVFRRWIGFSLSCPCFVYCLLLQFTASWWRKNNSEQTAIHAVCKFSFFLRKTKLLLPKSSALNCHVPYNKWPSNKHYIHLLQRLRLISLLT